MTDDADDPRPYGRRAFLALLAGGASSFLWAPAASRVLSPLTSAFSQLVGNLFPVGGWRIYTISGSMPIFDPNELAARDRRARPASRRASPTSELLALPRAHQVSTFHCVTGWTVQERPLVGRAASAHLLDLVEPLPTAKAIRFVSLEEPYNDSLTLEQALLPDVMLALEMDGQPLSRPHGAPARVVIPEMYGYKGVKWLTRIELARPTSRPATGKASATTRTPGSGARMATAERPRLPRFTRTERAVHWVHATAFLRPARHRPLPLPAEPRRGGRPPAAPEDDPHLHGGRLGWSRSSSS